MVARRSNQQPVVIGIAGAGHQHKKDIEANLEDYFESLPSAEFVILFHDNATQKHVRNFLTTYDAPIRCVMQDGDDLDGEAFAKVAKPVVVKQTPQKFARLLIDSADTGDVRLLTWWDDDDADLDRAVGLINAAGIPIISVTDGMQAVDLSVEEEAEPEPEAEAAAEPEAEEEEEAQDPLAHITWSKEFFADYESDQFREVKKMLGLSSRGRFNHDSTVDAILKAAAVSGYQVVTNGAPAPQPAPQAEQKAAKAKAAKPKAPKPAEAPVEATTVASNETPAYITSGNGQPLIEVTMVIPRSVLRELVAEAVAAAAKG